MSALITRIMIQYLTIFLTTLALVVPVLSNAQSPENVLTADEEFKKKIIQYLDSVVYIIPGRSVGPLRIGMSFANVISILGEPYSADRKGVFKRRSILIFKTGANAWIRVEGRHVVEEIGLEGNPGLQTEDGIRIGMSKAQVVMISGKGFSEQEEKGEKQQTIRYNDRGVEYTFQNSRLFQINVFPIQAKK